MRKGLRKMIISSAALLLLFALVAPSMSATDSNFSTSADPTDTSWSDNSYTPPTSNPDESAIEPVSEPEKDADLETVTADTEEPSQPEEFQPEIPVVDEDPGDPDDDDSPILKKRGKSNPQGQGYSGKFKKMK